MCAALTIARDWPAGAVLACAAVHTVDVPGPQQVCAVSSVHCSACLPCHTAAHCFLHTPRSLREDADYPTYDPYLNVTPTMKARALCCGRATCATDVALAHAAQTIRDVVQDYLVNKTIFFVGDSINGQVYQAGVRRRLVPLTSALSHTCLLQRCEMIRWGLDVVSSNPSATHTVRDEALTARIRAYWRQHARCVLLVAARSKAPTHSSMHTGTVIYMQPRAGSFGSATRRPSWK